MSEGAVEFEDASPDVGFMLTAEPDAPGPARAPAEPDPLEVGVHVAARLAALGPPGWKDLVAVFALTVTAVAASVEFADGRRTVRAIPPAEIVEFVRERRANVAEPWWRLVVRQRAGDAAEVEFDYGDEPFPEGQRFRPEDYRADLETYPRRQVPVWLAAYTSHGDRLTRSPRQAAADADRDRADGLRPQRADGQFPDLPVMWARWALVAACFVATGSPRGPRVLPAAAWFEGASRSGSSLCLLPGGRAVLSGGLWDAQALRNAYDGTADFPRLYAAAPEWVTDTVLNPRAATGLLSFCYWWEDGHWFRGDSPPAWECAAAVPGLWTPDTVADIIASQVAASRGAEPDHDLIDAVDDLVDAADAGAVERVDVARIFAGDEFDVAGAWFQLSLAGLVLVPPPGSDQPDSSDVSRSGN